MITVRSFQISDLFFILLRLRKILFQSDVLNICINRRKFVRYGEADGAWTIIPNLNENSIVYSVGIGYNISFDLDIIDKHKTKVYAFDPTPQCIQWLNKKSLPSKFIFSPFGLAAFDGELRFSLPENPDHVSASAVVDESKRGSFSAPVKRLSELMKIHQHTNIDLLKIDIEGSEYEVIDNILEEKIHIKQLLIEFHHRFTEIGAAKTKNAVEKLQLHGFQLVYVSQRTGEEYTFIKNQW